MKLSLGGSNFDSKRDAKLYAQNLLHSHSVGEILPSKYNNFFRDMLLMRGDAGREKIGPGIKYVKIEKNKNLHGKGFAIYRTDGTKRTFSYKKCFINDSARGDFIKACRDAVHKDIPKKIVYSEVHHADMEFGEIVDKFLQEKHLDFRDIKISDSTIPPQISDPALREEFREFHRQHAKYEIVSKEEHMKIHKKANSKHHPGAANTKSSSRNIVPMTHL